MKITATLSGIGVCPNNPPVICGEVITSFFKPVFFICIYSVIVGHLAEIFYDHYECTCRLSDKRNKLFYQHTDRPLRADFLCVVIRQG